ncbi:hypothetical protein M758_UG133500 [Ceratodon purpureus]|nr:hypothetical protein M758_UG133500 [Ceratodon purpureus]
MKLYLVYSSYCRSRFDFSIIYNLVTCPHRNLKESVIDKQSQMKNKLDSLILHCTRRGDPNGIYSEESSNELLCIFRSLPHYLQSEITTTFFAKRHSSEQLMKGKIILPTLLTFSPV